MKQLVASTLTTLVFLGILLVSAGRLDYWQAWLYASVSMLANLCTRLVLRKTPEVARERAKPGEGAKRWDKTLLALGLVLNLVTLVVAGLDSGRWHWAPQLSRGWSIAGIVLTLLGSGTFLWAMKENRFFSAVVRIQTDRGHAVCTTGPYAVVRHPGYAGMIIGTLGLPCLFTSAWSAIVASLSVVLLVVRTRLEDTTLEQELAGYGDYQRATRFRLIPGVW